MAGEYILQIFPDLWNGFVFTLGFWASVLLASLSVASLLAIINGLGIKVVDRIMTFYTSLIRGTPLLFQLYFVYFGFPIILGIKIDAISTAYLAYIVSWSAYLLEVIRGAILSVDRGQWDAAKVLGLNKIQTMLYVVLPQAYASAIPAINNEAVGLVYATALLSVLGISDILKAARLAVIRDFRLEGFLIAGIMYAFFGGIVIFIFKKIEFKLNNFRRR